MGLSSVSRRSSPASCSRPWRRGIWRFAKHQRSRYGEYRSYENPAFHDRSNYIDIQYLYTRTIVKEKRIKLEYVPTKEILADLLMKSLPRI